MFSSFKRRVLAAGLAVGLCIASGVANAAAYMKLGDIKGEATAAGRTDWIEIESWSFGLMNIPRATRGGGGGGGGAGKVQFQDFHFAKRCDKASPSIFLACATGQSIPVAEFELTRSTPGAAEETYLTIKLSDCLVSSYQTSGSEGDTAPTDQFSLNFTKIEFTYYYDDPINGRTAVTAGYDLKAAKKV